MGFCGSNSETVVVLLQQGVRIISQGFKSGGTWREAFRILTTILLSLLLPLSFLLLARLSTAHFLAPPLLVLHHNPTLKSQPPTSHLLSFLFIYCDAGISTILYALLSLITFAAFVHGLTARRLTFSNISRSPAPKPVSDHIFRPRLYAAWIILCTLQVCVGLGIEGSIDAGIDGSRRFNMSSSSSSPSREGIIITSLLTRIIFFVGLHETMHFWSTSVVKPVVDDTVMGFFVKEERWPWIERVGMTLSLGTLWWWKLRDEVDSLVVVAELKRELQPLLAANNSCAIGVADFVGWWLYYLTVTIGSIRLLKGGIWLGGMILLFRRRVDATTLSQDRIPDRAIYDKV